MQEALHIPISRRSAFKLAAGGLIGLTLGAKEAHVSTAPDKTFTPRAYREQATKTTDPIFRAASVYISSSSGDGHGGIFIEGNELYLVTINHVIDDKKDRPNFIIPNPTETVLTTESDWEYSTEDSVDRNIRYMLKGDVKEFVEQKIKNREIVPLRPYRGKFNTQTKFAVPMPNNGELSEIHYEEIEETGLIKFRVYTGYACKGFSGVPVLRIDESNTLTPESIGLLSRYERDTKLSPSRVCSDSFYFLSPHLRWAEVK